MRFAPLTALLLAATAMPAAAQDGPIDQRVGKLEKEMRAVQRKVFPGGAGTLEPEIRPAEVPSGRDGVPATSSINDLTARVDSLERQLATLTGQVEQNGYKLRQLEEGMTRLRGDTESRLTTLEGGTAPTPGRAVTPPAPVRTPAVPPAADKPPVREPAASAPATPAATGDAGEDAYMAGFRLWEAKRYAEAATALKAVVGKYPSHKRASYAQNLLGRSYLDDGKPALAAEAFYANYKKMPRGERAPDSLYYLGQALTQLKKPTEACKVYEELADVYGEKINQALKDKVAQGRTMAKCGA